MSLMPFRGVHPSIAPTAWVAPSADVIGDTTIGARSSIWFGSVLRGDMMPIRIGEDTSIQDNSVCHTTGGWRALEIGDGCTVGHGVILHGCKVGNRVLVGMGSVLLDAAEIGDDVILGAGSLVTARTVIPPGVLAFGRPAKPVRDLREEELERIRDAARRYADLVAGYREEPHSS